MNTRVRKLLLVALFLFESSVLGQVSHTAPKKWKSCTYLDLGLDISRLQLALNGPESIRQELLDTNTVRLIANCSGLSEEELSTIQVAPWEGTDRLALYQIGRSEKAFKVLSEQLRNYIRTRKEGHTRAFLLAALTNRASPLSISDPDLRALATNRPLLAVSWLKKEKSGTSTNKAGTVVSRTISTTVVDGRTVTNETTHIPSTNEVCRWVLYTLTDGDIGWSYLMKFKSDGTFGYLHDSKCDAKEYDPKYKKVLKEVEAEVEQQMKANGTFGQFGSVHSFWHLKKDRLKARGIEWRSPSELNPNVNYD
jgi:hypothetical protein